MDKKEFKSINEHDIENNFSKDECVKNIANLIIDQDFGVLATKGESTTYGSLVSLIVNDDMKRLLFATPNYTRKYKFLSQFDDVAMLVDNRNKEKNISKIAAVTILGTARELTELPDISRAKSLLLKKHHYLSELFSSAGCAIFQIDVKRYCYVTHIQEVYEWRPV